MKRIIFAVAIIATCSISYAQETLSDRWKETKRTDLSNKAVAYTDTLRLSDVSKDGMNIRRGAFQYKGQISNDLFEVGDLQFGIMKNDMNEIQLRDEEFIHIFTREKKDMSAADAVARKANIDLPAMPVEAIDKNLLNGNWEAYKRGSRTGPLSKVDYKSLIKTLSFDMQKPGDYYGTFTTNFIGGEALYSIKDIKASDLVADDKNKKEHLIKVWRLTAEELVIEDENGIVYYMKHFK
jgi:hypothetical protein